MFIIDLDDFKAINDTYGHSVGDNALVDVSEALKASFRSEDVIGRLGGDEFMVFMPKCSGRDTAAACAERLMSHLKKLNTTFTISIGIFINKDQTENFDDMYRNADSALYFVKNNGKNNYHIYTEDED